MEIILVVPSPTCGRAGPIEHPTQPAPLPSLLAQAHRPSAAPILGGDSGQPRS